MYLYMYISLVEVCIYVHSASMCPNACAIFLMKRLTSKHQQLDSTGGGPAFSTWGVWDSSSGDKWDSHKMQTRGHKARRFPSPQQINAKKKQGLTSQNLDAQVSISFISTFNPARHALWSLCADVKHKMSSLPLHAIDFHSRMESSIIFCHPQQAQRIHQSQTQMFRDGNINWFGVAKCATYLATVLRRFFPNHRHEPSTTTFNRPCGKESCQNV